MTGVTVGVDLGASNVRAGRIDAQHCIETVLRRPVPASRSVDDVISAVAGLVRDVAGASTVARAGVGVAAWTEQPSGVVLVAPNLGWKNVPLRDKLALALGAPVRVTNDLNAIAWGEFVAGAGRGAQNLLCVYVGSGIGGGLVLGGALYEGSSGLAGEIGHFRTVVEGRLCGCGGRGCLEQYAGGEGIAARVREDVAGGLKTALRTVETPTAADVVRAAAEGDGYARSILEQAGGHLAVAIGAAISLVNPDRVVMGGSVWNGSKTLRDSFLERLPQSGVAGAIARARVVGATLGDDAGVLGAALLATAAAT